MNITLLLFIAFLLSSCSPLVGNSTKAIQLRHDVSSKMMDFNAPDGCSFNEYTNQYMCDEEPGGNINDRVAIVREKMELFIKKHPNDRSNDEELGRIILEDLYHCRDRNGRSIADSDILYCKTKLPNVLIEKMEEEYTVSMTKTGGLYKYIGVKK